MNSTRLDCIGTELDDFGFGEPVYFDLQPLSTRTPLTARLLDAHWTNGEAAWSLANSGGMDLYRTRVACIGTELDDFGFGEPVYFDLQPLSTRIKLMCKLIIIIQGACLERGGPPRLVQDRCIQFDGDQLPQHAVQEHQSILNKVKSSSCDDLLSSGSGGVGGGGGGEGGDEESVTPPSTSSDSDTPTTGTTLIYDEQDDEQDDEEGNNNNDDDDDDKTRARRQRRRPMCVFGTAMSVKATTALHASLLLERKNSVRAAIQQRRRSSHANKQQQHATNKRGGGGVVRVVTCMSDDESLLNCSNGHVAIEAVDSEKKLTRASKHKHQQQQPSVTVNKSSHGVDIESYFKYRTSKYGARDYASAPYYQYSASNTQLQRHKRRCRRLSAATEPSNDDANDHAFLVDRATNTDASFLREMSERDRAALADADRVSLFVYIFFSKILSTIIFIRSILKRNFYTTKLFLIMVQSEIKSSFCFYIFWLIEICIFIYFLARFYDSVYRRCDRYGGQ